MNFFNLHAHTSFGLSDGYGNSVDIANRLKHVGQDGIAITDHGTLAGHAPFARHFGEMGLHLVFGCEMYVAYDLFTLQYYHVTVLAKTNEGYENLRKIVIISNNQNIVVPRVTFSQFIEHSKGLIVLSGCFGSGVFSKDIIWPHIADRLFETVKEVCFYNTELYIELQPFKAEQVKWSFLVNMANKYSLPCLVTADCHYPRPEDAHTYAGAKPGYPLHIPSADEILTRCKAMGRYKEKWIRDTYDVAHSCKVEIKS